MELSATTANRDVPRNARNQRVRTTPVRREHLPHVSGSPSPDHPPAFDRPAVHARPPAASSNRHFLKVAGKAAFLALAAAVYASASAATTPPAVAKGGSFNWPSAVAPCNTTLQACINGVAAESEILVTTSLPIDEDITFSRSVRLLAARNVSPRFAAGRGITGNVGGSTPWFLVLRGFRLTDARILLVYSGSSTATILVDDLQLESSNSASPAGISVRTTSGSSNFVRVRNNRLRVTAPLLAPSAIGVEFGGGTGTHIGDVIWNEISGRGVVSSAAILASATNSTTAEFRIQGNTVRGEFQRAGIEVSEGFSSDSASTVTARVLSNAVIGERGSSGGISSLVNQGSTNAQIVNNTVVRTSGIRLSRWTASATGTTSGSIFNNLIVANRVALQNQAPSGTANNDYNLLRFNENPGAHTPGANDVNADPQLRSLDAPRLGPGSPAIDAGNNFALIGGGTLPLVDGDGLRRLVNGDGSGSAAVDIGAYEYGHRMLLAPSNAASSNGFPINDALINVDDNTRLFTALDRFARVDNPGNARPTGVYFDGAQWQVFNQDLSSMLATLAYNVFHPLPSIDLTMHTVTTTIPGFPNASAIGSPDAGDIVFADQNWNGSGAPGIYNNHPIAVGFSGGAWFVHNADGATLPAGAKFNIYSQPPTPNVFRVEKQADDPLSSATLQLTHPLLDGNRCARLVAVLENQSPSSDAAGAIFDLAYSTSDNRWRLFSQSGPIIGKAYNVLVVPEQVSDCTQGPLFRDQFEP